MLYFVMQTIFLSLLIFIIGLFVGIFVKNILCKQRQKIKAVKSILKTKGRRYTSRRGIKQQRENSPSHFSMKVKPNGSAAMAKKRTTALVQERRQNAKKTVMNTINY